MSWICGAICAKYNKPVNTIRQDTKPDTVLCLIYQLISTFTTRKQTLEKHCVHKLQPDLTVNNELVHYVIK